MDTSHTPLSAHDLHHGHRPHLDHATVAKPTPEPVVPPVTSHVVEPPNLHAHRNRLDLKTEGMPTEIRRDYIHEYYVLVAPKRAGRPYDVASHDHPMVETANSPRLDLQKEIYTIPDDNGGWSVKVVENKFPALTRDNEEAYGQQEIVIDTPLANTAFGELNDEQISKVLLAYQVRARELSQSEHIKYVSIFRNDGYEAGASLAHAHSQIFALPFAPPRFVEEAKTIANHIETHQSDPYDEILRFEQSQKTRIIAENDAWLCFAPYAPQWQMEAWILPKRAVAVLPDVNPSELHSLAPLLRQLTSRLNDSDINFNLSIEQGVHEKQRLTIKVRGRNVVSPWGGLEVSTGLIINTIPSEAAAEWYRRTS